MSAPAYDELLHRVEGQIERQEQFAIPILDVSLRYTGGYATMTPLAATTGQIECLSIIGSEHEDR